MVEVHVSKVEEDVIPSSKTNIFMASFTSWARLELYSYLEKLREQVLYFDTDSIIYLWRDGLPEVKTGPFLGEIKMRQKVYPSRSLSQVVQKITAIRHKREKLNAKYAASR